MPEWLRGQTRNLMGSARVGSNPAANDAWLDGRAVQGASFRHWSLRRRGFESHSNHRDFFLGFVCAVRFATKNLFGRVPTCFRTGQTRREKCCEKKKKLPRLGIAPRLPLPQSGVLLLYYLGERCAAASLSTSDTEGIARIQNAWSVVAFMSPP